MTIPASTWAVFEIIGSMRPLPNAMQDIWKRIYSEWLPNSGYEHAMLPEIEIRKPDSILAKETISSMQAGLMYGQSGQTEYIIKKVKEETGIADMKVVATGGLGRIISEETDMIDIYDSSLTLDGLYFIYKRNRK